MEFGRSEGPGPSEAPCTGPRRMRRTWGRAWLRPHHRPCPPAGTEVRALTADLRSGGRLCSSLRHLVGNKVDATKKGTNLRGPATYYMWTWSFYLSEWNAPHQTMSFRGGQQSLQHPHTSLPAQSAAQCVGRETLNHRRLARPTRPSTAARAFHRHPCHPGEFAKPLSSHASMRCHQHFVNILRPPSFVCKSI